MDVTLVSLVIAALVICLTIFILNKRNDKQKKEKNVDGPPNNTRNAQVRAAARNRLVNRIRARNADEGIADNDNEVAEVHNFAANLAGQQAFAADNEDDNEDNEDGDIDWSDREKLRKKLGTKKLAKLEAKAERKEQHEQMLREREERKERERKIDEERRLKDEDEKRLEKAKEDEEKRLREEQEKRDHEEYLKLKQEFTIEEEGQDSMDTEANEQNLLQKFVDHIKNAKVVILEDLAAEFKLRTQDVVNRINQVQDLGLLTGVLDDRGKFIYISEDEMKQIVTFIRQRGRVSIAELAQSSNELISLNPVAISDLIEEIQAV